MPAGIVDLLEMVKVQDENGECASVSFPVMKGLREAICQQKAVRQVSELIMRRQIGDSFVLECQAVKGSVMAHDEPRDNKKCQEQQ